MGNWLNRQLRISDSPYLKGPDAEVSAEVSSVEAPPTSAPPTTEDAGDESSEVSELGTEPSEAATFEQRRAYKLEFQAS